MALTAEQRIEHHEGYGASSIGCIVLGEGHYDPSLGRRVTRYDLWSRKVGELPEEQESPRFDAGHAMEPVLAKWLEREDRIQSVELANDECVRHALFPWILAHLDAWVTDVDGNRVPGELKTCDWFAREKFGPSWTDEMPMLYLVQMQVQAMVADAPYVYGAAAIGFGDFRYYKVDADEKIHEHILAEVERFKWHVDQRVPPEPKAVSDFKQRFRESVPESAKEVGMDVVQRIARREAIRARIKAMEAEVESIDLEVWPELRDAEMLTHKGVPLLKAKTTKAGARPWTIPADALTKIRRMEQ